MMYERNLVPKIMSGHNRKVHNLIARGYVNYLRGRELCHNLITNEKQEENVLCYFDEEARVLACFIQYAHVNNQLIMPKALRKYGVEGKCTAKTEVKQLHDRVCFRALSTPLATILG